jgi:hypothetical protein
MPGVDTMRDDTLAEEYAEVIADGAWASFDKAKFLD